MHVHIASRQAQHRLYIDIIEIWRSLSTVDLVNGSRERTFHLFAYKPLLISYSQTRERERVNEMKLRAILIAYIWIATASAGKRNTDRF